VAVAHRSRPHCRAAARPAHRATRRAHPRCHARGRPSRRSRSLPGLACLALGRGRLLVAGATARRGGAQAEPPGTERARGREACGGTSSAAGGPAIFERGERCAVSGHGASVPARSPAQAACTPEGTRGEVLERLADSSGWTRRPSWRARRPRSTASLASSSRFLRLASRWVSVRGDHLVVVALGDRHRDRRIGDLLGGAVLDIAEPDLGGHRVLGDTVRIEREVLVLGLDLELCRAAPPATWPRQVRAAVLSWYGSQLVAYQSFGEQQLPLAGELGAAAVLDRAARLPCHRSPAGPPPWPGRPGPSSCWPPRVVERRRRSRPRCRDRGRTRAPAIVGLGHRVEVALLAVDPGDRPQRAILPAVVGLDRAVLRVQIDRALEVAVELGRERRVVHRVEADLIERLRLLPGSGSGGLIPSRLALRVVSYSAR